VLRDDEFAQAVIDSEQAVFDRVDNNTVAEYVRRLNLFGKKTSLQTLEYEEVQQRGGGGGSTRSTAGRGRARSHHPVMHLDLEGSDIRRMRLVGDDDDDGDRIDFAVQDYLPYKIDRVVLLAFDVPLTQQGEFRMVSMTKKEKASMFKKWSYYGTYPEAQTGVWLVSGIGVARGKIGFLFNNRALFIDDEGMYIEQSEEVLQDAERGIRRVMGRLLGFAGTRNHSTWLTLASVDDLWVVVGVVWMGGVDDFGWRFFKKFKFWNIEVKIEGWID
jgi:hypothetical protein